MPPHLWDTISESHTPPVSKPARRAHVGSAMPTPYRTSPVPAGRTASRRIGCGEVPLTPVKAARVCTRWCYSPGLFAMLLMLGRGRASTQAGSALPHAGSISWGAHAGPLEPPARFLAF